jgi:hypothetical protein
MRTFSKVLLGGAAAVILAGTAAYAESRTTVHHLSIRVPGLGVERIDYTGNVAPNVVVLPDALPAAANMPVFYAPFAELNRISAEMNGMAAQMDREMAVSLARFRQPWSGRDGLYHASIAAMPAGASSFSFVSTVSGSNVCSRMVQITGMGSGKKPDVVTHTSGNCGNADNSAVFSDRPAQNDAATPIATHGVLPTASGQKGI